MSLMYRFVYDLSNIQLGKTWALFVCLREGHARNRGKWALCKPTGHCVIFQGSEKDGSHTLLMLAALQLASKWEKSAVSLLCSQTPPTRAITSSSGFPALGLMPTCWVSPRFDIQERITIASEVVCMWLTSARLKIIITKTKETSSFLLLIARWRM